MINYIITGHTMAIIPSDSKKTEVLEVRKHFIFDCNPNKIVIQSCLFYGSSYEGRLKGTESLTGYNYKAPIIINSKGPLVFFPTSSPRLKNVMWFNLNSIKKYFPSEDKNKTILQFINNKILEIDVSYNIINNQILRATNLEAKIRKNHVLN